MTELRQEGWYSFLFETARRLRERGSVDLVVQLTRPEDHPGEFERPRLAVWQRAAWKDPAHHEPLAVVELEALGPDALDRGARALLDRLHEKLEKLGEGA